MSENTTPMTEAEKAAAEAGKSSGSKSRKRKTTEAVNRSGQELQEQTKVQVGSLAHAATRPLVSAIKMTASQQVMLEVVQSMPDILQDAEDGLNDFFASFNSEEMAFSLTSNLLPPQTKLALTAGE